jgi:sRNA-binding carbon storage regulator CsrA
MLFTRSRAYFRVAVQVNEDYVKVAIQSPRRIVEVGR